DCEELAPAACEDHRIVTDMSTHHAAVGNVAKRDALREIGSLGLGLLATHGMLLQVCPRASSPGFPKAPVGRSFRNGINIGWIGWPAILSVPCGLLTAASKGLFQHDNSGPAGAVPGLTS